MAPAEEMLVDKAQLITLTAPELHTIAEVYRFANAKKIYERFCSDLDYSNEPRLFRSE